MCLQIIGRQVSPQCISHLNGKLLYKKQRLPQSGRRCTLFQIQIKKSFPIRLSELLWE